jgi:flagellar motor switch protein FliM
LVILMADSPSSTVVPVGRGPRVKAIRPFRVRPARTLKDEHERVLSLVGDSFCRVFGADLSAMVRSEVVIAPAPSQQWSWADLLAALPEYYCAARVAMPPMLGSSLLTMDMSLATAFVERLLGGAGQPQERSQPLTEVETSLLLELHQRIAGDLAEALSLVVATEPMTSRQESRLELIRAAPARTLLVVLEFDIDMGTAKGALRFAIPAEPLLAKLENFAGAGASEASSVESKGTLAGCPVEGAVRFNDTVLRWGDVIALAPGDVVTLSHHVSEPLSLCVGGIRYLPVVAGRRGHHKAFAVVDAPQGGHR